MVICVLFQNWGGMDVSFNYQEFNYTRLQQLYPGRILPQDI
jgi:hypothetical protein